MPDRHPSLSGDALKPVGQRGRNGWAADTQPDRYVTFKGIDGDGNAHRLVAMLRRHIDDPAKSNLFWDKFKEKLAMAGSADANGGRVLDELFLIHSYINNIRELFEEYDDQEALVLLHRVEAESC